MTEPDTFHARCIDSDFTGDYSLFWWFVGPLGNLLGPLRGLLGPLGGLLEVSWQSRQQHCVVHVRSAVALAPGEELILAIPEKETKQTTHTKDWNGQAIEDQKKTAIKRRQDDDTQ